MAEWETDRLLAAVARKRECLARLREVGLVQRDLIVRGEISELMRLLAAKQRLLDQLKLVELELAPFRGQAPEQRVWRDAATREACAGALRDCQSLLATIVDQERESETALQQRRDEAAVRLEGAVAAGHSRAAYAEARLAPGARSLDLATGD